MRKFSETIIKLKPIRSKTILSNPGLIIYFIICLFLCNLSSLCQEIPEITPEDLPGCVLSRNECFDGGSLWGYMNGGADIYLEYGFEKLRVEEFSIDDETIKLELFRMIDPISAFGIFSFKTFKCKQSGVITTIDCLNRFQFQLSYGDYYIQLISERSTNKTQEVMISIAEILLKKLEHKELELPVHYLTDSLNFSLQDIKMLKGELGIQDKAMDLTGCFKDIEDYQIYYAKTVVEGEKVKYYEVVFDNPDMKKTFLEKNKDKELQIVSEINTNILIQQ